MHPILLIVALVAGLWLIIDSLEQLAIMRASDASSPDPSDEEALRRHAGTLSRF
jgi:hypothetical protein